MRNSLPKDAVRVRLSRANFRRIVDNLLSNAIKFSPTGEEVHIELERNGGGGATVRISDNGPGIPEKILAKLFDPFFTTKPVGQGTGLGLSISYQIVVERHGGKMQCHSTPGHGTEFVIEIPVQPHQSI